MRRAGGAASGRPQLFLDAQGVHVADPVTVRRRAEVGAVGSPAQAARATMGPLQEADDEGREGRDHDDGTDGVGDAGDQFGGHGRNHALIGFPPKVAEKPRFVKFLPTVP